MTDMFFWRWSSDEHELSLSFNKHSRALNARYSELDSDIRDWRLQFMKEIDQHVSEQRARLQAELERAKEYLNKNTKDAMEMVKESQGNRSLVQQIEDEHRRLRVDTLLLDLSYNDQMWPVVQKTSDGARNGAASDKAAPSTGATNRGDGDNVKYQRLEKEKMSKQDEQQQNKYDVAVHHPTATSYSTATRTTIDRPPAELREREELRRYPSQPNSYLSRSSSSHEPMKEVTNDRFVALPSNSDPTGSANAEKLALVDKCPLCLLIFPTHMTLNDRHSHVERHTL